jgi:3-hydroxyisobutyrate dehydrogenase-like beta-hydroxyacid dehydrogenase
MMDPEIAAVISQIPAWAGANELLIEPARGLTNRNYLATVDGARYLVRLGGSNAGHLGIDRESELAALQAASSAGNGGRAGLCPEHIRGDARDLMKRLNVGVLHPGQMGISLAATAKNSGHTVYWASAGRSQGTRGRAEAYDLLDAGTLEELCRRCSVIVSVCPPHAAEEVAHHVLRASYRGLYLDANAISPQRAQRIGEAMAAAGVSFVDGGIIGGPAWEPGRTWLYLSGEEAELAASCFAAGPLETSIIGDSIGKASALKMCYAAYTKGTTALLCAILAAAEKLGVRAELEGQWSREEPDFPQGARRRARGVTAKAWRFVGEMEEISATFAQAGLPGDFHAAAAAIYRRLAHFKGAEDLPSLEEVLGALSADAEPSGRGAGL